MSAILTLLASLVPLALEFFKWRNRADDRARAVAPVDAMVEDMDGMDEAIVDGDLVEIGRLLNGLDDPRPVTRGI